MKLVLVVCSNAPLSNRHNLRLGWKGGMEQGHEKGRDGSVGDVSTAFAICGNDLDWKGAVQCPPLDGLGTTGEPCGLETRDESKGGSRADPCLCDTRPVGRISLRVRTEEWVDRKPRSEADGPRGVLHASRSFSSLDSEPFRISSFRSPVPRRG